MTALTIILSVSVVFLAAGAIALGLKLRQSLAQSRAWLLLFGTKDVLLMPPEGVKEHDQRFQVVIRSPAGTATLYGGPHGAVARRYYENANSRPDAVITFTDYGVERSRK